MESFLSEVGLSQHRNQDSRNGWATFRLLAPANLKRACRPEIVLSKALFQG